MNPTSLNPPDSFVHKKTRLSWLHLLAGLAAVVLIVSMVYVFRTGTKMAATYTPQIDATMEIKLEATQAHLWFEEILSGDRREDMDHVWALLDSADWYAQALLEGGTNKEGVFLPLKDKELRQAVEGILRDLAEFREMTSGLAVHEIICDDHGKPHDYRFLDIDPTFVSLPEA